MMLRPSPALFLLCLCCILVHSAALAALENSPTPVSSSRIESPEPSERESLLPLRREVGERVGVRWGSSSDQVLTLADAKASAQKTAKPLSGQKIYAQQCARCHGKEGEGVSGKFDGPLHGNRTLEKLTGYIDRNMPDDDPGTCKGPDAAAVAKYIYDAFYSTEARLRKNPARVELVRLTNRQYQNTVADLLRRFSDGDEALTAERGLRGTYYRSREFSEKRIVLERRDPQIDFDLDAHLPDEQMSGTNGFSIQWRGALLAEDTGDYELVVKSPNGVRLFLNNSVDPLIDQWVSNGQLTEHRATIRLLGGRIYPLQLHLFRYKETTNSISLSWKPPHGSQQLIPSRNLLPVRAHSTFVVTASFPPDDSSVGYERGVLVSKAWDEATTQAAIETANYVVARLDRFSNSEPKDTNRAAKVEAFCTNFVTAAFRRPLSPDQLKLYVTDQFKRAKSTDDAVKRVVLLALKSPRFLYLGLDNAKPDDFEAASRLSFGIWDSLPDRELTKLAAKGALHTRDQITAQAQRMLRDPRAHSKALAFLHHWLQMDRVESLSKDDKLFPGFTPEIITDLRTSLDIFLEDTFWSDKSDYRTLLTADYIFANNRLAQFYGLDLNNLSKTNSGGLEPLGKRRKEFSGAEGPERAERAGASESLGRGEVVLSQIPKETDLQPGTPIATTNRSAGEAVSLSSGERAGERASNPSFQGKPSFTNAPTDFVKVTSSDGQRCGVLTHPYLLAAFSYAKQTSPIHRGVFLTRNIVGRSLKPPPIAVAFKDAEFAPHLTMRQKVSELTRPQNCQTCHSVINPLGFSLEHYDAVGRFRTTEQNVPIDSSGDYVNDDGETIRLTGARDIAKFALGSEQAQNAFIEQFFHQVVKQPMLAYGSDVMSRLRESFVASEFNLQKLLVQIAVTSASHGLESSPATSAKK